MNSILKKIIYPVILSLILVFILLIIIVTNYSSKSITSVYEEDFKIITNQIYSNIEALDNKLISQEQLQRDGKKEQLSSLVFSAISIIEQEYDRYVKGEITEEDAKENSLLRLREFNYGGSSYFWIDDSNYICQLLPPNSSIEGTDRSQLKDKNNTYIVKVLVDESLANGESFLSYWFPKPGEDVASEKLGHTKLFKPWGWVVGTGFYIDDIEKELEKTRANDFKKFNEIIQSKNEDGIYPIIATRDSVLISTPDNGSLMKQTALLDAETDENLVERGFDIKDGLIEYHFLNGNNQVVEKMAYCKVYENLDWVIMYTLDKNIVSDRVNNLRLIIFITSILSLIVIVLILLYILKTIISPLNIVNKSIKEIASGNLGISISDNLLEQNDEVGEISKSLKFMINKLSEIVSQVSQTTTQVTNGSFELSQGNQDLSIRTEQQATALEETSAAIEEINASIRSNAENTISADKLSNDTFKLTRKGAESVKEMISSMEEINDSSKQISDIIEVINNIAFQTNLLALNASIEAARAGVQGKGFAVVAVEVRKLAKRSDKAASKVTEIISNSNKKIVEGVKIANVAGDMLKDINNAVQKVSTYVSEISETSQEQLLSVDQIDKTLVSLDQNTQQNAALVEEAATSTEQLSHQAKELSQNMRFFKLDKDNAIERYSILKDE